MVSQRNLLDVRNVLSVDGDASGLRFVETE